MATTATVPIVARSALRYRPIDQPETEDVVATPTTPTPRASRTVQIVQTQEQTPVQQTRTPSLPSLRPTSTKRLTRTRTRQKDTKDASHWTLHVGLAMLAMVVLLWLGQALWSWGTLMYNNIHYGLPRTTQTDAFVGHEKGDKPSHFIALNDHGQVEIIEMPGDNAAQARIFFGPQFSGPQADLIPVTLQFPDPQHTHHPDMIIVAQQSQFVFKNEHGTFVAANNP
jgi:hypothetical protein